MNLLAASRNPFVSLYTSLVSILCGICMWMFPRHCADDVSNISYTLKHYAGQPAVFLQSFFPSLTLRSPDFIGKITDSFMIAPITMTEIIHCGQVGEIHAQWRNFLNCFSQISWISYAYNYFIEMYTCDMDVYRVAYLTKRELKYKKYIIFEISLVVVTVCILKGTMIFNICPIQKYIMSNLG